MNDPVAAPVPRPAATLILVRDTADGLEVFLMQRTHRAVFMPGVFVFPGGAVDDEDQSEDVLPYCGEVDDVIASRQLGLERGGLGYLVAAVRECFEEAGLLLAYDKAGELVEIGDSDAEAFAALRERLTAGEISLADVCRARNLSLALDRLEFFSHWVTPAGPPRRYDTRFFVAVAPRVQTPSHDDQETIAHVWIRPAVALERSRQGEFPLASPTIRTLKALAAYPTTAALMEYATSPREVTPTRPRFAVGRGGRRLLQHGDPAYAEICKLDPGEEGTASYEIVPGAEVRLSGRVRRITAPNPSFMTGPGTNSYLIDGAEGIAVIDPGPSISGHVERLVDAAAGRLRWILTTHTHSDHSPAAVELKARTGAEVLGMRPPPHGSQDQTFDPDRVPAHGERLDLGGAVLRVIHTPGHASNHLCYLLEEERMLFAGDHIMQGSTVVINPPDGDMGAYLRSLTSLQEEELDYIAPAHGFLLDEPSRVIDRLITHRMAREAKVMAALRDLGSASETDLVPVVYQDVPSVMHRLASRSLLAHLLKLREEGRVALRDEIWSVSS